MFAVRVSFQAVDGPAPKGRTQSGAKVRSRSSLRLVALSGLLCVREITQGEPSAMFSWPLRATEQKILNVLQKLPLILFFLISTGGKASASEWKKEVNARWGFSAC